MIQHILIPVDFSDTSENAVVEAAKIAQKLNAQITLLHAYLIPGYTGGMAYETFIPPVDEHIELINKQIDDFANEISELEGLKVNRVAIPGSVQDMIGAYVEDNNVDLVISGTKGSSGFMGFLLGTQSERIEGEVSCPVLVLPDGQKLRDKVKLALAHDYKSTLSIFQRDIIRNFIDLFNGSMNVVHVEAKQDTPEIEESIKENLQMLNPTFHKVVNNDIEKGLNDFVKSKNIDVLVIIYHDHSFLNRIFGKSTSRQLTYHTKIPILVLK